MRCYLGLGVNNGKGRWEHRSFSGVHRVINTFIRIMVLNFELLQTLVCNFKGIVSEIIIAKIDLEKN